MGPKKKARTFTRMLYASLCGMYLVPINCVSGTPSTRHSKIARCTPLPRTSHPYSREALALSRYLNIRASLLRNDDFCNCEVSVTVRKRMAGQIPSGLTPAKSRKRAAQACLACRARKVRCDVTERGPPCMHCHLDDGNYIVKARPAK